MSGNASSSRPTRAKPQAVRSRLAILLRSILGVSDDVDELQQTVRELRLAIETGKRVTQDLRTELALREAEIERLRLALAKRVSDQEGWTAQMARQEERRVFVSMLNLFTQYPTLIAALQSGADIPDESILGIFALLDDWAMSIGVMRVGSVGGTEPYNPRLHRLVGPQSELPEQQTVRVRYTGYKLGDEILARAEVVPV